MVAFLIHTNLLITFYLTISFVFLLSVFGETPPPQKILSFALLVWQIYTLDRYLIHEEDQKACPRPIEIARFIQRHKGIFRFLLILSLLLEIGIFIEFPSYLVGYAMGLGLSLLYIWKIPGFHFRIKQIPYIKAFYVPAVSILTFLAYLDRRVNFDLQFILLYYLLLFFNTLVFDLKDLENDKKSNIRTLAQALGANRLINLVIFFSMGAMMMAYFGPPPWNLPMALAFLLVIVLLMFLKKSLQRNFYYFVFLDGFIAFPYFFSWVG